MIRVKAVYEHEILKPLEKLELEDGEEVEIELRRKGAKEQDILRYAGLLKDLSEEEERLFQEAIRRRSLFGRTLSLWASILISFLRGEQNVAAKVHDYIEE